MPGSAGIWIGSAIMFLVVNFVDPAKNTLSRWTYWLVGPALTIVAFSLTFINAAKNPTIMDTIGITFGAAALVYTVLIIMYLRWRNRS